MSEASDRRRKEAWREIAKALPKFKVGDAVMTFRPAPYGIGEDIPLVGYVSKIVRRAGYRIGYVISFIGLSWKTTMTLLNELERLKGGPEAEAACERALARTLAR